jgi:ethanolamine utilization microcompartment shell protein EutS
LLRSIGVEQTPRQHALIADPGSQQAQKSGLNHDALSIGSLAELRACSPGEERRIAARILGGITLKCIAGLRLRL